MGRHNEQHLETFTDMSGYPRIPQDFIFKEGTDYSIKYRRTEHRFTYDWESEMYLRETYAAGKKHNDPGLVIVKDVLAHMNYYLNQDERATIIQLNRQLS